MSRRRRKSRKPNLIGKIGKAAASAIKFKRRASPVGYSSDRTGITPQEWCKQSGLKKGWREIHLQRKIAERLRDDGYVVKENVEIKHEGGGHCEADIVIYKNANPWQVLEVKPYLNRSKVIEGTTQARAYSELLHCSEQPILIGLAPYSDKEYWGGKNAIKTVAHNRVGIIYLNEDRNWFPEKNNVSFWERVSDKLAEVPWKIKAIAVIGIALGGVLVGWEFSSEVFHPEPFAEPQGVLKGGCPPCPAKGY